MMSSSLPSGGLLSGHKASGECPSRSLPRENTGLHSYSAKAGDTWPTVFIVSKIIKH